MTAFPFDSGPTLADRFRRWAGDSQRIYPCAVRAMADDWEAGGVTREVCRGYEDAPKGAVIQLRLLAGVSRLVLSGRADQLRAFYRCFGGTAEPTAIWPVLRAVIAEHVVELRNALAIPPQTNEVGRSAALLVGLLSLVEHTGRHRIRLLELGASAGLNLLVDAYAIEGPGWTAGPADSPLRLTDAIRGELAPAGFEIVARRGCDPHPIDPAGEAGRLLLRSYVWPDDLHRFERLNGALAVVHRTGAPPVDAASAADWLAVHLADAEDPEVLTVVWNSVTQQYWPSAEVAAVADLIDTHGRSAAVARISMEFRVDAPAEESPELRTVFWPGDGSAGRDQLLGHAHHHGIPVYLDGPARSSR